MQWCTTESSLLLFLGRFFAGGGVGLALNSDFKSVQLSGMWRASR